MNKKIAHIGILALASMEDVHPCGFGSKVQKGCGGIYCQHPEVMILGKLQIYPHKNPES